MRAHTAFRRIVLTLVALALLAGQPRDAWAAKEQDWWGWLEEFSGPGPFKGWELSLEVLCINLASRRSVPQAEVAKLKVVEEAAKPVLAALTAFEGAARDTKRNASALSSEDERTLLQLKRRLAGAAEKNDPKLETLTTALNQLSEKRNLRAELTGLNSALDARRKIIESPEVTFPILFGGTASPLSKDRVKARSSSQLKLVGGGRRSFVSSCRGAQVAIEKDRQDERDRSAELMASAGLAEALSPEYRDSIFRTSEEDAKHPDAEGRARSTDIVLARRDWQTGIVINFGSYQSLENGLFDPDKVADDEPQVRLRPFEVLAHSKLSSSIDIGAGLGFARITTEGVPGTIDKYPTFDPDNADSKVFYLVPLSVVVRPGRLFTNSRWASILGYRMSLRYFGDLDRANFAVRPPPTSQTPVYKQSGEFVWGAAFFVDLVSAFELALDPKGK